jgi:hypothetical protein
MPKLLAAVFLTLLLAFSGVARAQVATDGPAAFSAGSKATLMTDDEMDDVTAAGLSNLFISAFIIVPQTITWQYQFGSQINIVVTGPSGTDTTSYFAVTSFGTFSGTLPKRRR